MQRHMRPVSLPFLLLLASASVVIGICMQEVLFR